MFPRARRIFSIRGIGVHVDASWLFIAALATWSFFQTFDVEGQYSSQTALGLGFLTSMLFFASVLAHELAHALEARHRGLEVGGITLFLFGGVTETRTAATRPRDEFAIVFVGPYTSLVLAAAFGLIAFYVGNLGELQAVQDVAGTLGWINAALGIFNLLPGAPLDGGGIVRAGTWAITKDRTRGVAVAARSGQVVGAAVIAFGIWQLAVTPSGGEIGGFWMVLVGWLIFGASRRELAGVASHRIFDDREARELMSGTTIDRDRVVATVVFPEGRDVLGITDAFATIIGAVTRQDVEAMHVNDRDVRPVADLAIDNETIREVAADTPLPDAVRVLFEVPLIRITEGGRTLGFASRLDVHTLSDELKRSKTAS